MTDEWVERRVADLKVGDDVRDYGVIIAVNWYGAEQPEFKFKEFGWLTLRPAHARVDIRRPAEVTVQPESGGWFWNTVLIDGLVVANFRSTSVAEEYAARLRSSAHDRALALGKDTT